MSYPRELDEFSEQELIEELSRRSRQRMSGICDYCGRYGSASPCRYGDRHRAAAAWIKREPGLRDAQPV